MGDAPAEPPVCGQPPKTVPLGNDWLTSDCGPSGRSFFGVCGLAARQEPRPGVMKIWPCGQIRFTRFYLVLLRFRNREDGASHFSFCEISMDASAIQGTAGQTAAAFKSRPGALVWFFRKSRDSWKVKSRKLRVALKREQNQVAAVTKSREQWKSKAQQAAAEQAALQREIEALREQVRELAAGSKKSRLAN